MNARIKVIENSTGKLKQEINIDLARAILLLAALPDLCKESEARYTYTVFTVHDGGVEQRAMGDNYYSSKFHPIDLEKPFDRKHDLGATKIILDLQGVPAGNAIIKAYDPFTRSYTVDAQYQGSDNTETDIQVPGERLICSTDIVDWL